jgi:tetratricopeptide (TPR) repeat protein
VYSSRRVPAAASPSVDPPVRKIRCYACGRRAPADGASCPKCSASFRALCGCGADISTFADRCSSCGAAHVATRLPRGKHPAVRAARWTLAAVVVGGVAWATFGRRPDPAWRLLTRAGDAMQVGDYATAFQIARTVTEEAPGDARGWYLLSASLLKLGMSADAYVPAAERAALLAPEMFEPRNLLALHALDVGRTDVALEHALAASRAPGAGAAAFRLLARVELAQPRPDLARARDALDRARKGGRPDPESTVLLAEMALRTWGGAARGGSRLPPELRRVLVDAADAPVASTSPEAKAAFEGGRARILLALGRNDDALAAAETALAALPADAAPRRRSDLELAHAMALSERGGGAAAAEEFVRALARTPDAATAGLIASYFGESGDLVGAEAILTNAARSGDPFGALHAVLAGVQLQAGRVADADASIAAARAIDGKSAAYAAIESDVRLAQGRWQEARIARDQAARLAPKSIAARVDLALLEIDRPGPREEREKALRDAVADLESRRAESNDDPVLLRGLGTLKFALGEFDAAIALLRRSSAAAPWDAETWSVLGEALLARPTSADGDDGSDESAHGAARAFAQAAALRPSQSAPRIRESEACLLAGDPAAALAALDECAPADRGREDVLRRRAIVCIQLGDWRAAAADLERVRATAPGDPAVLVCLVDVLLRVGDAAVARRLVAEAQTSQSEETLRILAFVVATRDGRGADALDALARSTPSVGAAELLLSGARVDDAVAMLRSVLAAKPGDPSASRSLVFALLDGDAAPADRIADARAVAAALPPDAPAAVRESIAGRILLAAGDPSAAAPRFDAAAAADRADPYAPMLRGEALFRTGDRGESLRSMRRALTIPGAPASFRRIVASRLLIASESSADGARRLRLAEEAFRTTPDLPAAAVRFAELLSARGEFGRAADVLEKTLRDAGVPGDLRASIVFTAALQRFLNSEPDRARALIGRLPAGARESSPSRLLTGYVALHDGRADEADAAFASVPASDPQAAAAAVARVDAALASRRPDEARRRVDAYAGPAARLGWFLARVARLYLRDGLVDDAAACARRAADSAPDDRVVLVDAAAVLAKSGHADDAVARLTAYARDARTDAASATAARLFAGRLTARIPGRASEALAIARAVADDASASPSARREAVLLEAEARLCADDVRGAAETARPLLADVKPSGPETAEEREFAARVWHVLGTALSSIDGGAPEAAQFLGKALEADPDDEVTANNLAWLLSRSSDTAARGLELARRATAADPTRAAYWDTRAACAVAAGASDDAETSWRKAIALIDASPAPDLALRAQCGLGVARILLASSRQADAIVLLDRVARDAPGSPTAAEAARLRAR